MSDRLLRFHFESSAAVVQYVLQWFVSGGLGIAEAEGGMDDVGAGFLGELWRHARAGKCRINPTEIHYSIEPRSSHHQM